MALSAAVGCLRGLVAQFRYARQSLHDSFGMGERPSVDQLSCRQEASQSAEVDRRYLRDPLVLRDADPGN